MLCYVRDKDIDGDIFIEPPDVNVDQDECSAKRKADKGYLLGTNYEETDHAIIN